MTEAFKSREYQELVVRLHERVTRYFSIFYFILALLAIPPTLQANDQITLLVNCIVAVGFLAPLILVLRYRYHVLAAKILVFVGMASTMTNSAIANFDTSLATSAWYFVFVLYSHLVLGLRWGLFTVVVGVLYISLFSLLQILGMNVINPSVNQTILQYSTPFSVLVTLVAISYLLNIYRQQSDLMFQGVVDASNEKSKLIGVMSHDIRNSLGAIKVVSSMMKDDLRSDNSPSPAIDEQYIDLIDQASSDALQLVEEVVVASESNQVETLFLEQQGMLSFIDPILQRYNLIAKKKGIELQLSPESNDVQCMINREKFSRVIENLLSNAIKFSHSGGRITASISSRNEEAVLSITDTGIGIPEEMKDKIFDPFTEAGRAGTANEKSFGLGMSIVKSLVEAHKGRISVNSEAGKGTRVEITLPLC